MTVVGREEVTLAVDLQAVSYVSISFLTILFYDWIICLNWEITRIWHSKWSLVKVLYLYVRYAPFVSMIIAVQGRLTSTCDLLTFDTIFAGVAIGMADLILMLRTYSIYNKSRKILAILSLLWIIISSLSVGTVIRFTNSFQIKSGPPSQSCFLNYESSPVGLIIYLGLLAGEIVITLLTVWKTFDSYLKSEFQWGQVLSLVYCEGLFFYFLIIPFTIANVAVLMSAPNGLLLLLDSPLTVMHSVLGCRLVLHVREVAARGTEDSEDEDDLLPMFIITIIEPYMSSKVPQYYV